MTCLRLLSTLLVLLCVVSSSIVVAWSDYVRQIACENLHIGHTQQPTVPAENVTVTLMENGIPVPRQCFEFGATYTIELKSSGRPFKGLLMKTEERSSGQFLGEEHQPDKVTRNVCKRGGLSSVSHKFLSRSSSNQLGSTLNFGYTAPTNETIKSHIALRYTVVFSFTEYYENQFVSFPPCSELATTAPETTVTTESATTEKNTTEKPACVKNSKPAVQDNLTSNPGNGGNSQVCTDFEKNPGAAEVSGNCGRISNGSLDSRTYVNKTSGIKYDCMIDTSKSALVRKTYCTPTCISKAGEQLCCKIGQVRDRKRWYTCSPHAGEQLTQLQGTERSISVQLWARVEKTCVCYKCSDVTCTSSPEEEEASSEDTDCDDGSENGTKEPKDDNSSL